jgi:ferredoxin
MKCRVDPKKCESHQRCTSLYPELFEVGADNKARVKFVEVPDEYEIDAQSASNSCPAGAIVIEY